jgi:dTDP-4-amino-4,6-dideoxygalactose transaminase
MSSVDAAPRVETTTLPETTSRWRVPLSDLRVDDEIAAAVDEAVRSGWWSMGPRVEAFEREFAALCDSRHAFAVANGTAALHLALLALGIGRGDTVLVPSLNFVAGANCIRHVGAEPVFCDVRAEDDLTVSPEDIEAAIGPTTRAIMVMHYGGHPCRMDEIMAVARRHGLPIIEDASHAPGARLEGRACGTFGAVGCFSFFSNKNLPLGEGGMVVTDDDTIAERLRLLRSHGMTTLTWDRHRGHAHAYDVVTEGFNYRLDELRAAIGLVQLGRLEAETIARGHVVDAYRKAFDGVDGLTMPFETRDGVQPAHHLAVVLVPLSVQRDEVRAQLAERRIQTSVHYPPIHTFSHYASDLGRRLPVTDAVADRVLTLPLFPHMVDDDVAAVSEALLSTL